MDKITTYNNITIDIDRAKEIDKTTDLKNKWYGLNSTDNFGCCTYLYSKFDYPDSYEDFYYKYTNDEKKDNLKEYGRSESYIYNVAEVLAKRDKYTLTIDEYYSYIVKKLIVDTFDGCQKEKELKGIVESKGYTTLPPTLDEDLKFGIDLKVVKDGKMKCLLQCKPNTFFYGNKNNSLINDRKKALQKESKAEMKFGVPVYYCIYYKNTGEWVKNKNNGYCFKLQHLINKDGTT